MVHARMAAQLPITTAAAAFLVLGGCAAFGPTGQQTLEVQPIDAGTQGSVSPFIYSPPNYAGITAARILIPRRNGTFIVAEFSDGKEQGQIEVEWLLPDGERVTYRAADVRAFEGQAVRGEVERAIVETTGQTIQELTPELRSVIETAITAACTAAGGTC